MQQINGAHYCKKCKQYFPDFFPSCPRCGSKPGKQKSPTAKIITAVGIVLVVAALALLIFLVYQQANRAEHYRLGKDLMEQGKYVEAQTAFGIAGKHEDAAQLLEEAKKGEHYQLGQAAFDKGDYETAIAEFTAAEGFSDSAFQIMQCEKAIHFQNGEAAYAAGDMDTAIAEFTAADDWPGVHEKLKLAQQRKSYNEAVALMDRGDYSAAIKKLEEAGNFTGTKERMAECYYELAKDQADAGNYAKALEYLDKAGSGDQVRKLMGECSLYMGKDLITQGKYAEALTNLEKAKSTVPQLEPELDNYILLCKAEKEFVSGSLAKGLEYYGQIPQTFKPAEFNITARRGVLTRVKNFAQLEGEYYSDKYDIKVSKVSGGYIYTNYYPEGKLKDQYLKIDCVVNADGTVTVQGSVMYYYFTEYVGYSLFYSDKTKTLNFKLENMTWVPSSHRFDSSTVLYLSGNPRIQYQAYTNGSNASSNVTYTKK